MANLLYINLLILVVFVTCISCSDVKRSVDGIQTEVNVNLSDELLRGLAKVPKKMDKQEKQLQNLTEIVAKMADVMENLLQSQLTILSERLPIPSSPTSSPTTIAPQTTAAPPPPFTPLHDCQDVANDKNHESGVYTITPQDGQGSVDVYCEITVTMDDQHNGWIVIQKRFDGSVDFQLDWAQYEEGFGNLEGEHWAGLKLMHRLTKSGNWQLSVNVTRDGNGYALYDSFRVDSSETNYTLHVSGYSGTASDSLHQQDGQQFTTPDRRNTANTNNINGGWWYDDLYFVNLNGDFNAQSYCCSGIVWYNWNGFGFSQLLTTQMKIRVA